MSYVHKQSNVYSRISAIFILVRVLLLLYSMIYGLQVEAFIGLGLTFWGVIFALARSGKYVESSLLDVTAKSAYSTLERVIADLKFAGQGYYIAPYPPDASLPQYLTNLKEPVVFISDNFNGKPSVDELANGKFFSEKNKGVFIVSPGSGIMAQIEKEQHFDFSKVEMQELLEILPHCLTEQFNLARTADMTMTDNTVTFKAQESCMKAYTVRQFP